MSTRDEIPVSGRPVAAVLAAAAAAPHAGEYAGEEAALAAFRSAQRSPGTRRSSLFARYAGAKLAAIGLAVLGTTGVAVAAGTGALPERVNPFAVHDERPGQGRPGDHPGICGTGTPLAAGSGAAQGPSAQSSTCSGPERPDLPALCLRWHELDGDQRRAGLDRAEFADLVREAGAKDAARVERFCDGVSPAAWPRPSGSPPVPRPSGSHAPRPGGDQSGGDQPGGAQTGGDQSGGGQTGGGQTGGGQTGGGQPGEPGRTADPDQSGQPQPQRSPVNR